MPRYFFDFSDANGKVFDRDGLDLADREAAVKAKGLVSPNGEGDFCRDPLHVWCATCVERSA